MNKVGLGSVIDVDFKMKVHRLNSNYLDEEEYSASRALGLLTKLTLPVPRLIVDDKFGFSIFGLQVISPS